MKCKTSCMIVREVFSWLECNYTLCQRRGYLISCSRFRNSGQSKNSGRVISGALHSFWDEKRM